MDIDTASTDLALIDKQAGNCHSHKELTTHDDPSRCVITGADEPQPFQLFRKDFPAFDECIYMNLAGRGLLSRTTRAALDAGFDDQMMGRVDKSRWKAAADDARRLFAGLVHARPNEIACTKNVSDGLNAIATALPWSPGDNVVYCPGFDHPNAAYAWLNLDNMGVERRPVPLRTDGRVDVAAVVRATDSRTRLVTVSSVNFASGIRAELGSSAITAGGPISFFLSTVRSQPGCSKSMSTTPVSTAGVPRRTKGCWAPTVLASHTAARKWPASYGPYTSAGSGSMRGTCLNLRWARRSMNFMLARAGSRSAMRTGPGSSLLPPRCANWDSLLNRLWSSAQWTSLRGSPRA